MKTGALTRLLVACTIPALLTASSMTAVADNDDPFSRIKANTGDASADVKVERDQAATGDKAVDLESTESSESNSRSKANTGLKSKYVELLQPFCLGGHENDGTGYIDCFEIEQTLCTEDGSQYVIRARYERADPTNSLQRFGQPFCSEASDPVISDPAEAEPEAPPMPVVTLADFRRLDIAPSKIESDSGGFGLIRANTNFYATDKPQTLNTTMLGQPVAIQAIPVQWTFTYGDGSAPLVSTTPGGPQREFNQETTTSHAYQQTGTFPVTVATAYRGQFSVNGGPWIAIPGTASVPSTPVEADIWRSEAKNVAEDCHQNPDGWACANPFIED